MITNTDRTTYLTQWIRAREESGLSMAVLLAGRVLLGVATLAVLLVWTAAVSVAMLAATPFVWLRERSNGARKSNDTDVANA